MDVSKKEIVIWTLNVSMIALPVFAATKITETITYTLPDPPVVFMIDIEPKGVDTAAKGACAPTFPIWDQPYIAVDALAIQEEDIAWGKELRDFKGRVMAESRFSSPEQVQQLMSLYAAALEGDPDATADIADRYYDGLGLPNNFKYSLTWYRKAAELGSTYAMYILSELYGEGWIVDQDPDVSARWYLRAQEQPNALLGMRQLGQRYANHEAGMYILSKAFFWMERAANYGDIEAQLWMGDYYADTEHLNGMMALKWYGKAASASEPQAYYGIAQLYDLGHGIPVDYKEALKWYEKAGRLGLNVAQYHLGEMYAQGRGVPYDPIRAWAWLEVSKGRYDNEKVDTLQYDLIADMLPEHRLYAADLAAEFRLFNTGPRTVTTEQASKITKKEKAPAAKKAIARAKIDEQMD